MRTARVKPGQEGRVDMWRDILRFWFWPKNGLRFWYWPKNGVAQASVVIFAGTMLPLVFVWDLPGPAILIAIFLALGAAWGRLERAGLRWAGAAERDDFNRRRAEQERRLALAGPDGDIPLTELVTAEALSRPPRYAAGRSDPLAALIEAEEAYRKLIDKESALPPLGFKPVDPPSDKAAAPPPKPVLLRPSSQRANQSIVETPRRWGRRRAPPGSIVQ